MALAEKRLDTAEKPAFLFTFDESIDVEEEEEPVAARLAAEEEDEFGAVRNCC